MSATHGSAELWGRKRELRGEVKARLQTLSQGEISEAGARACAAIAAWLVASGPQGPVALFAARAFEIDVSTLDDVLREAGRPRLLPAIRSDSLVFHALPPDIAARELPPDRFGIPTPPAHYPTVPLAAAALVVVPACAINVHGHRLGWGKGYYDRALTPRKRDGRARGTVALALDAQLVDAIPLGPGDVLVERLCTPSLGLREAVP